MTEGSARRHHYLTASYLGGFTKSGKKNGQLFVMEVGTGRSFKTSPKNIAVERDFNRINVDGLASDAIENALAPFEQEAVQSIESVSRMCTFPRGMDYHRILNLLCLFAVRNPLLRAAFNRSREQVLHQIADLVVSDKKIWESQIRSAEISSEQLGNISFEQMRHFVMEKEYKIEFSTDSNLAVEFETFNQLLPILGGRHWSLLLAPEGGPEFICCDHPVALTWKKERVAPIGFALLETEVFLPLTRRTGFYGVFEDPLVEVVNLTPSLVASMNARVAQSAERHLYCAMPTFVLLHGGQVREVNFESRQGK